MPQRPASAVLTTDALWERFHAIQRDEQPISVRVLVSSKPGAGQQRRISTGRVWHDPPADWG
jgi:hypothetical protein